MNTIVTTREQLLATARKLAAVKGLAALNIRDVAQADGISIGSVYNYFPSKADLMVALVGSIWQDILPGNAWGGGGFVWSVGQFFEHVKRGSAEYPAFFSVHAMSLGGGKEKGRSVMGACFGQIKAGLLQALEQDARVCRPVFTEAFTRATLVEFAFGNVLGALASGKDNCQALLFVLEGLLYESSGYQGKRD
ncbi:MAG: TetR/AcrR family transcriptional regulator [Clostridia bacterium]